MSRWRWVKVLGNVGPVLGALVLFASWVLQQSLLQRTTTQLQQLSHAEGVYQTIRWLRKTYSWGLVQGLWEGRANRP